MKTKICSRCKKEKDEGEFNKEKRHTDGLTSECKKCHSVMMKKYYQDNKERARKYYKEYGKKYRYRIWASSTLRSHKSRDYIVKITVDELEKLAKQTIYCSICDDIKLDWGVGTGFNNNSPTLDRTNNEKVLRLDNVQIICQKCNSTKSNRTMKEFIEYCKMVVKKYDNNLQG